MVKNKFKIYSLGCKINQYDGGKLSGLLVSAGFISVEKDADIAIVNTCCVTKSAITKSRQTINHARRENPRAKIVISGCLPKISQKDLLKELGADLVLDSNNFKNYKIKELFKPACRQAGISKFPSTSFRTSQIKNSERKLPPGCKDSLSINKDRTRYFLKVQDGCEQYCTYCIIPYARGRLASRKLNEVLKEARVASKQGFEEIVVSGIHLGLYGINNVNKEVEEKNVDLARLLEELTQIKEIKSIRLSSIEITEVSDKLIDLMAREDKIAKHLHISLQSGCDKILKVMKRPYDTAYFKKRIKKIRQKMPDIAISTDVIVGFPGETKRDFNITKRFIKDIFFSRLHVFSFSAHRGTPAWSMEPKVSQDEIKKRSAGLRKLNSELQKKYKNRFKRKIVKGIAEAINGDKLKIKTEYYFDIWIKAGDIIDKNVGKPESLIGNQVRVRIS